MANKGKTSYTKKQVREAVEALKEMNAQRTRVIIAVIATVIVWAIYTAMRIQLGTVTSFVVYGIVLVIVVIIGEIAHKWATLNTEYKKIIRKYGLDEELVKEELKRSK